MAVPSVTRTWQYSVNNANAAGASSLVDAQNAMFEIKSALIGFATNPWTVIASSNSTTSGFSDLWTAPTDLIWDDPLNTRSWILLRNGDGVESFEVLIDCAGEGNPPHKSLHLEVSFSGFDTSGFNTSTAPTASDGIVLKDADNNSGGYWFKDLTDSGGDSVIHVWHADTGLHTRVVGYTGGIPRVFWIFEKIDSPVSGLSTPYIVGVNNGGTSNNIMNHGEWNSTDRLKGQHSSKTFDVYMTSEGWGSDMVGQHINAVNSFDGGWPASEIGLVTTDVEHSGRLGDIKDLWWGPNGGLNELDTFPAGGSKTHIYMGQLIFPWNGSVPVLSG